MNQISYQNKDVSEKYFAELLKEKSFGVFGFHLPKIVQVLPTNLPTIEANELRIDNLFELEDKSIAIVDYESKFLSADKVKYLNYIVRVLKRSGIDLEKVKIRMIVIYTADVTKVKQDFDIGCLRLHIEAAYLTGIDTETVYQDLKEKIKSGERLTDEETMKLIILPLTIKGKKGKQEYLEKAVEIAKTIPDRNQQLFALSGIMVFSDKIIEAQYKEKLKGWIRMTGVGRLYEIEKEEAVREAVQETAQRVEKETAQRVEKETAQRVEKETTQRVEKETAQRVVIEDNLEEGISVERIIEKLIRKFNMTREEAVQKIQMYAK